MSDTSTAEITLDDIVIMDKKAYSLLEEHERYQASPAYQKLKNKAGDYRKLIERDQVTPMIHNHMGRQIVEFENFVAGRN